MEIERMNTGISGFDELIEGGIPNGDSLLIAGGTGTGKTILALQIAHNKASEGKNVLYATFEEDSDRLVRQMESLGLSSKELVDKGLLNIYSMKEGSDINDMYNEIKNIVESNNVDLLVIDSLTMLMTLVRHYSDVSKKIGVEERIIPAGYEIGREAICSIIKKLSKLGPTPIFIDEADEKGTNITKAGVAEFLVDGVIILNYVPVGAAEKRTLIIRKMRDTQHSEDPHPLEIVKEKGIIVKAADEAFGV